MPPKRKAAPKKKKESPPPSESEPESEPEYSEEEEEDEEEPESPQPKKTKPSPKSKAPAAAKPKVAPAPSPRSAKAAPQKKQPARRGAKAEVVAPVKPVPKTVSNQVVIIEHCKQCQSFKRTALKLEALLKKAIPDLEVTMNPEKPRKGIFEVRDNEGNVFISLQGLVRPFKKMKDLNLEETADDVVSKLA